MVEFLASSEFWAVLFKCLITALLSLGIGALCTLFGKLIAKCKNSKLMKHARIAVRAAEQKFPNEGKKMGPEKMAYVMDYLAITFPKIKSNQYLYNIAEAAVYELNKENIKEEAEQTFKDKYGEIPESSDDNTISTEVITIEKTAENSSIKEESAKPSTVESNNLEFNLKSF